jgi:hypothetical protein
MVEWYDVGFFLVAVPVFVAVWVMAVDSYGFLLGLGLGWFPAAVVAVLSGTIWPILLLSLVVPTLLLLGL